MTHAQKPSVDSEMHELNAEADLLEQKTTIVSSGANGEDTRLQSHNADPDAQAMVIDSLRTQVQDLFSQVTQLNNLRQVTLQISQLELECTLHDAMTRGVGRKCFQRPALPFGIEAAHCWSILTVEPPETYKEGPQPTILPSLLHPPPSSLRVTCFSARISIFRTLVCSSGHPMTDTLESPRARPISYHYTTHVVSTLLSPPLRCARF